MGDNANEVTAQAPGRGHAWRFFRRGGLDQVRLEAAADFANLDQLDPKLWVALSCPVRGVEFDARTLEMIDTDRDGRIRVPDVLAAVKWAASLLKDPSQIARGLEELPLSSVDDTTEAGKRILAAARHIMTDLGKPDDDTVSLADTGDISKILTHMRFNGDGIVRVDSADAPATQKVLEDIARLYGVKADRSGTPGVDKETVDRFYKDMREYMDWWERGQDATAHGAGLLPLGDKTPDAARAVAAVRAKVDDYFARCRLAEYAPEAAKRLNPTEADMAAFGGKDFAALRDGMAVLPLAHIEAGRPLPLGEGVNPAWADALSKLGQDAAEPLLGGPTGAIAEDGWRSILERLGPYEKWQTSKPSSPVEALGLERIREVLAGDSKTTIEGLFALEAEAAPKLAAVDDVDRLVRYNRWLYVLLNNFVSFADFYASDRPAVFQAGTLYLDGRSCELCIRVDDVAKHSAVATLGKAYLVYCDCVRKAPPDKTEKMTIVAAVTAGASDSLMVGRNGVLLDRQGRDWDATVVKVIENPIGLREAFWAPYRRMGRMIAEQVEKLAAAREKAVQERSATAIETAAKASQQPPPPAAASGAPPTPAAAPFDIGKTVGVLAAIGLAVGALGTAVATIAKTFLDLTWWQMPLAILGVAAVISGPSVILAWLKLRQRVLGPILDGAGWAINGRIKITLGLGRMLTGTAALPPGAVRSLEDPYQEKALVDWRRLGRVALVALVVVALAFAAYFGLLRLMGRSL